MTIEPATLELCRAIDLSDLPRERIWGEIEKLLLQARRAVLPSLEVLGTWLTDDVSVPRTEMAKLIHACAEIAADVG